jgi:hypothetical protein
VLNYGNKYIMNLQNSIKQIFISTLENPVWDELKNKFDNQVEERLNDELYVKLSNGIYRKLYQQICHNAHEKT